MALNRAKIAQTITSFADQSPAAQLLSIWYFADRDAELTDWPYPFANKWAALNQVSTTGIPACPEWIYSYRYPADCLSVRRLVQGSIVTNAQSNPSITTTPGTGLYQNLSFTRQDGNAYPYPFELAGDTTGRLIMTDCPSAWIRYTRLVDDASQFSADFSDMLAWRVAMDLYPLSRDEKARAFCEKMYRSAKETARARLLNEGQNDRFLVPYEAEYVRGRYCQ
jgi:hypothetical protein